MVAGSALQSTAEPGLRKVAVVVFGDRIGIYFAMRLRLLLFG